MDLSHKDSTDRGWPFENELDYADLTDEAFNEAEESRDGLNRIFQVGFKVVRENRPASFYASSVNFCHIIFVLSYVTKSVKFVCLMCFAPLALCFMHFAALCNLSAILVSFFC